MAKKEIVAEELVEVVATNDIPADAEVVEDVKIDAPGVIIKLRAKVTTEFLDKTADLKHRKKGDIFEVDESRVHELAALGYVEIV
jgi:hypothetical protein